MGTFSITTYNNQLVILYNSEEGDEIQLSSITFFNPSVEVKGNKFSFFESGTYKKSISFKEIYLINDVEPTDSEDAFNKIIEGIGNFNRGGTAPYKVYTALLTQTGENAPTAVVLENTLGTISFSYIAEGRYDITSSALFTNNKTTIIFGNESNNANGLQLLISVLGEDRTISKIPFRTAIDEFVENNNVLLKTTIEIRVYN
jgi:hypothetical protein